MKKTRLIFIGFLFANLAFGQTINIHGGTSFSKLDWHINNLNTNIYNKPLIGISLFAGIDYFDSKFFNLSSNVGFIRKGGKQEINLIFENPEPNGSVFKKTSTLDYLSINTLFDLKYLIKGKIIPFVTFGPRFDILIKYSDDFTILKKNNNLHRNSYGIIIGGGFKYQFSNILLGVRSDYYLNLSNIAKWSETSLQMGGNVSDKTFTTSFTIGYKLINKK